MQIEKGKKEIIEYLYKCDICGKEFSSQKVCSICGIDICYECSKVDPRDMGDYPTLYCINCFNIGEKYLEQIYIEEEKFDSVIEKLEQEWKEEALNSIMK